MIMDIHDSIIDIDSCIMGKYGSVIMDIKMQWWISMMRLSIFMNELYLLSIIESGISIVEYMDIDNCIVLSNYGYAVMATHNATMDNHD